MISPEFEKDSHEVTLTLLSCVRDIFKDSVDNDFASDVVKLNLKNLPGNESLIDLVTAMANDPQYMAIVLISIIMNYAGLYKILCDMTGEEIDDRVLYEQSLVLSLMSGSNYLDE